MAASASVLARNIFIAPRTYDSSCTARPGALLHPDTVHGIRMLRRTSPPAIDSSALPPADHGSTPESSADPNRKTSADLGRLMPWILTGGSVRRQGQISRSHPRWEE